MNSIEALKLILPLAKGYVREHSVGSNQVYIQQAESILTAATDCGLQEPAEDGRVKEVINFVAFWRGLYAHHANVEEGNYLRCLRCNGESAYHGRELDPKDVTHAERCPVAVAQELAKGLLPVQPAQQDYTMEMAIGKNWLTEKDAAERIVSRIADNDCLTCKHWKSDAVYAIAVEIATAKRAAVQPAASTPTADSSDVERWKRDLTEAGWIAETAIRWRSPNGGLWRGPYGAWVELQRQKHADSTEARDERIHNGHRYCGYGATPDGKHGCTFEPGHTGSHSPCCDLSSRVTTTPPDFTEHPLKLIGQAESNGDLFLLFDGELGQHVLHQRLDDAELWATFTECSVGSITAREVYEAAQPHLDRAANSLTSTDLTEQARQLVVEWIQSAVSLVGGIATSEYNALIDRIASALAEAATQGQAIGVWQAAQATDYHAEIERSAIGFTEKSSRTRQIRLQCLRDLAARIREISPDPSFLNRVRNEAATAERKAIKGLIDDLSVDWIDDTRRNTTTSVVETEKLLNAITARENDDAD